MRLAATDVSESPAMDETIEEELDTVINDAVDEAIADAVQAMADVAPGVAPGPRAILAWEEAKAVYATGCSIKIIAGALDVDPSEPLQVD